MNYPGVPPGVEAVASIKSMKGAQSMKKFLVFSAVTLMAFSAFAQRMGHRPMFYDPTTVTTITGTIESVDTLTGPRGNFHLIELIVKDKSGTIPVNIGPSFYLDSQNITFKSGEVVEVTGSKLQFNGKDVIAAAKVKYDGKTIQLRDDNGRPVWARGGMR